MSGTTLPALSIGEYGLVYNMLSFALASMIGSLLFFVLARDLVSPKYRIALIISAVVVIVAGYHYFRIFESWTSAYTLGADGTYVASGTPFNDGYRYMDWLLTVPLLVAELVAVLSLPKEKSGSLTARLVIAAALMIVLGYPGEITSGVPRAIWGFLSTLPFVYIIWVLWGELGSVTGVQSARVKVLLRNTRLLLLGTWGFYPIVYLLPLLGISGASALVGVQVGYSIADVLAKCGYGLMIFAIARAKMAAEEGGK